MLVRTQDWTESAEETELRSHFAVAAAEHKGRQLKRAVERTDQRQMEQPVVVQKDQQAAERRDRHSENIAAQELAGMPVQLPAQRKQEQGREHHILESVVQQTIKEHYQR